MVLSELLCHTAGQVVCSTITEPGEEDLIPVPKGEDHGSTAPTTSPQRVGQGKDGLACLRNCSLNGRFRLAMVREPGDDMPG